MHIKNARQVTPLETEGGEIIHELIGRAAGGSEAHSLARIALPPGGASRPHYHPVAEESYYILSGEATFTMEGETTSLREGDSVLIPPGQTHQIRNEGDEPVVFLAICIPAWEPDNSVYVD